MAPGGVGPRASSGGAQREFVLAWGGSGADAVAAGDLVAVAGDLGQGWGRHGSGQVPCCVSARSENPQPGRGATSPEPDRSARPSGGVQTTFVSGSNPGR